MEKLTIFLKELTFKRILLYLFIAFLLFILIDVLLDPQGAIESFKEGYNQWD